MANTPVISNVVEATAFRAATGGIRYKDESRLRSLGQLSVEITLPPNVTQGDLLIFSVFTNNTALRNTFWTGASRFVRLAYMQSYDSDFPDGTTELARSALKLEEFGVLYAVVGRGVVPSSVTITPRLPLWSSRRYSRNIVDKETSIVSQMLHISGNYETGVTTREVFDVVGSTLSSGVLSRSEGNPLGPLGEVSNRYPQKWVYTQQPDVDTDNCLGITIGVGGVRLSGSARIVVDVRDRNNSRTAWSDITATAFRKSIAWFNTVSIPLAGKVYGQRAELFHTGGETPSQVYVGIGAIVLAVKPSQRVDTAITAGFVVSELRTYAGTITHVIKLFAGTTTSEIRAYNAVVEAESAMLVPDPQDEVTYIPAGTANHTYEFRLPTIKPEGDLLILILVASSTTTVTWDVPAGWTTLVNRGITLLYHVLADDSPDTITLNKADDRPFVSFSLRIPGPYTLPDGSNLGDIVNEFGAHEFVRHERSFTVQGITTTVDNCRVFSIFSYTNGEVEPGMEVHPTSVWGDTKTARNEHSSDTSDRFVGLLSNLTKAERGRVSFSRIDTTTRFAFFLATGMQFAIRPRLTIAETRAVKIYASTAYSEIETYPVGLTSFIAAGTAYSEVETFNSRVSFDRDFTAIPKIKSSTDAVTPVEGATELRINKPSGVTRGDLLVVVVGINARRAGDPFAIAGISNENLEHSGYRRAVSGGVDDGNVIAYYKVAEGDESNVLVIKSRAATIRIAAYFLCIGGDYINNPTINPLNVRGVRIVPTEPVPYLLLNPVTPLDPKCLLFAVACCNSAHPESMDVRPNWRSPSELYLPQTAYFSGLHLVYGTRDSLLAVTSPISAANAPFQRYASGPVPLGGFNRDNKAVISGSQFAISPSLEEGQLITVMAKRLAQVTQTHAATVSATNHVPTVAVACSTSVSETETYMATIVATHLTHVYAKTAVSEVRVFEAIVENVLVIEATTAVQVLVTNAVRVSRELVATIGKLSIAVIEVVRELRKGD